MEEERKEKGGEKEKGNKKEKKKKNPPHPENNFKLVKFVTYFVNLTCHVTFPLIN